MILIQTIRKNIKVFRDDIYPFLGGGNKGRKMMFIVNDIKVNNCNAVVTTGGIQSNHCRALAVAAAQNGWKCTLVLHGDKKRFEKESGNARIMKYSGAKIVFVDSPNSIGKEMDKSMDEYRSLSLKPYYVWGGGHNIAGGIAYIEAVAELKEYCDKKLWVPDYIFLATGTGSTQSGIMAGLCKYGLKDTEVIGVSVARQQVKAEEIINDFYYSLCEDQNISCGNKKAIVLDDYLCGGYEKFNEGIRDLSANSLNNYGFTLDTTYTGKAFYGMLDYICKNNIDGNILFWHTGGIFNFLA